MSGPPPQNPSSCCASTDASCLCCGKRPSRHPWRRAASSHSHFSSPYFAVDFSASACSCQPCATTARGGRFVEEALGAGRPRGSSRARFRDGPEAPKWWSRGAVQAAQQGTARLQRGPHAVEQRKRVGPGKVVQRQAGPPRHRPRRGAAETARAGPGCSTWRRARGLGGRAPTAAGSRSNPTTAKPALHQGGGVPRRCRSPAQGTGRALGRITQPGQPGIEPIVAKQAEPGAMEKVVMWSG